jgi:hypothetical protein
MANDPGLTNDTCIFMEAISGDKGNHDSNNVWWLSPDIGLIGPVSGLDNADAGQVNPVKIKFHRRGAGSNCLFPGDEAITVELWVANPSLAMSPRVHGSAKRIGFIGSPLPAEGANGTQQIDWDVPAAVPVDDPQSPGHKCLIARSYPDSGAPDNSGFFVPDDQHVAQRNLAIVASTSQTLRFRVNTLNPTSALTPPPHIARVKLRAILDLNPTEFVRRTVLNSLKSHAGFQQLRTRPLNFGFRFDLTGFQPAQVVDHSHPGLLTPFPPNTNPSFEAQIALEPGHLIRVPFAANLKGTLPPSGFNEVAVGEACIFHLIQTSVNDEAQGGLTLVALKL